MSRDGRVEGYETPTVHWELARALLDLVMGDPPSEAMVCLWYRATSAFLENKREYAVVRPHLARAQQLFQTNAELLLFGGALDEALASPDIQTVVQTTVLPGGSNSTSLRRVFTSKTPNGSSAARSRLIRRS